MQDESPAAPRREILYAALALVSLLVGISRLADPAPAPGWLQALDAGIALLFLHDWWRRVRESPRRARYALRHSYEVVTFVPFTLLPPHLAGGDVLRGARLLRLLRFVRMGRYAKAGIGLARLPSVARRLRRIVRHAQVANLFLVGLVAVSLGAAMLLAFERDAAGLDGYGAAFWWSLSLFTTMAYAVPPPSTAGGHVVAGGLMVAGVAYVGLFTASLAGAILRTPPEE